MAKTIQCDLNDGFAFARKLETHFDNGEMLVNIRVDHPGAVAACTFDARTNPDTIPPAKKPFSYDSLDGVVFAEKLCMHIDLGNKLIWVVLHPADGTVDCWFE